MNARRLWWLFRMGAVGLLAPGVAAQWQQQVIRLNPGWNAVFLEVQPEPSASELAFAGMPVRSAWMWDRPGQVVDFVDDPAKLVPGKPEWRAYLPEGDPHHAVKDLFDLEGGRALLVNLGGNQSVDWKVTGRPKAAKYRWLPDSYNLVGFSLEANSTHSFATLFTTSSAHVNKPVLKLEASGQWTRVLDLAKERVEPGRAYWVFTSGASSFSGPMEASTGQGQRLDFGDSGQLARINLGNPGPGTRTYALDLRPSAPPPNGQALVAGDVPLMYRRFSVDAETKAGIVEWIPWTNRVSVEVPAGEALVIQVEAQRTRAKAPPSSGSSVYQSLLSISDPNGFRMLVPVSMGISPRALAAGSRASLAGDAGSAGNPSAGLWIGNVLVDQVSFSADPSDPEVLRPARSDFDFRIIVHLDDAGRASLLQRVMIGQRPGDGTGAEARLVVMTDEDLAQRLGVTGSSFRNERPIVRRFSSPAFGFRGALPMESEGQFGAGRLRCSITNGFNEPLNPFKHLYHPDHDNLNPRLEDPNLPDGVESFTVVRDIRLEFSDKDPLLSTNRPAAYIPGYGDTRVGGLYRETLRGLHRRPIQLGGTFTLQRTVSVGILNDGK